MPAYTLLPTEELAARARAAVARLESCDICPRLCGVNRLQDERGFCRTGRQARVYSFAPHFGEEPPLVGRSGSGTIFFSGCNLSCVFCQNYDISQLDQGREVSAVALASMMLALQRKGCHNINFVTPTHVVPQILEALVLAREDGLHIPLVYNSGGYESVETLRLLEGIFDIYMPDAKYGSDEPAQRYSQAPQYMHFMKSAIREMHRQVGDLVLDECGIAVRGLMVRHLVLPAGRCRHRRGHTLPLSGGLNEHLPEHHASVSAGVQCLALSGAESAHHRAGVQRSPAPRRPSRANAGTGNPLMPGGSQ